MGFASVISIPLPLPETLCLRRSNRKYLRPSSISCSSDSTSSNSNSASRVTNGTNGQVSVIVPQGEKDINTASSREKLEYNHSITGGAYDFRGATTSLTNELLRSSKTITIVRHGLSTWNKEGRVQGSTDLSVLTDVGIDQAKRCRKALSNIHFDQCFASPISRAKETAEIIWRGREQPLVFMDSLKEAHLFFLEGMTTAEAEEKHPDLYYRWRDDPANFKVDGVFPVRRLWGIARETWKEILLSPGSNFLIVTHKSILRAMICAAFGLGPERFRAFDINNGGISVFTFNERGEAMMESLNMTAHMYSDHVYRY